MVLPRIAKEIKRSKEGKIFPRKRFRKQKKNKKKEGERGAAKQQKLVFTPVNSARQPVLVHPMKGTCRGAWHIPLQTHFPFDWIRYPKKKESRIRQRKRKKGNLAYNRVQRSSLTLLHHNCFSKPIWIFLPSIPFLCPPIPVCLVSANMFDRFPPSPFSSFLSPSSSSLSCPICGCWRWHHQETDH